MFRTSSRLQVLQRCQIGNAWRNGSCKVVVVQISMYTKSRRRESPLFSCSSAPWYRRTWFLSHVQLGKRGQTANSGWNGARYCINVQGANNKKRDTKDKFSSHWTSTGSRPCSRKSGQWVYHICTGLLNKSNLQYLEGESPLICCWTIPYKDQWHRWGGARTTSLSLGRTV